MSDMTLVFLVVGTAVVFTAVAWYGLGFHDGKGRPEAPRPVPPEPKNCPSCGGHGVPRTVYVDEKLCQSRYCVTCKRTWGGKPS